MTFGMMDESLPLLQNNPHLVLCNANTIYNPSSSARGSICFHVGSLKLPHMFLYAGNLLHHSVLPETFTSNLSQKKHRGGNICVVNLGSLHGEHDVEASSSTFWSFCDYVLIDLSFW